jgi:N5-(cytidine 5'-diphosphoramidyl)-L-glutamine hydrolase
MGNSMYLDALERDWYVLLKKHQLMPFPNIYDFVEVPEFDCLVITGGPDSLARHYTEDALFALALKRNKPIVGVCHGAFTVNDLTGGINGTVSGHVGVMHDIVMNDKKITVNSYHNQSIQQLGPEMQAVAHDLDGNIEAFEHVNLPIYGVVWHPERMNHPILTPNLEILLL